MLDELQKSLDVATKAIRRFVRDAEMARGSDLESVDASQLRIARQHLHQAVGALEMVGLEGPAKLLRGMEALAKKFVEHPELCSEDAAEKVEKASFALTDFLQGVMRGKPGSSVALFPQYRSVLELVGEERIHPADLWTPEWRWIDVALPVDAAPLNYEPAVRTRMDPAVLKIVKEGSAVAAKDLRDISLGLSAGAKTVESRVFWKISAAYFEAMSLGLCPQDVYAKRAGSRVLMQYSTLARGDQSVSDRLAQDLLFFCAQSLPKNPADAPVLNAVREGYGLNSVPVVDYEVTHYGRFDPSVLTQARKRIATATETWSALSGGDTSRLKVVSEQFNAVTESIVRLDPESKELARAFTKAVESTVRSGEPPKAPVAMEVATAILYLDATYEDLEPASSEMAQRSQRLSQRLEHVMGGGQPEPLEDWMEELYRRVSDRQTMGSVVDELKTALGEVEKSLDQFFRNPEDKQPLQDVPQQLGQMRGVFSVLGLDQASLATLRMRDMVEKFMVDGLDPQARTIAFEKFGNSLGALGFLVDMLSYQRTLAKKLFVYDEELGEFKPLMGRGATTSKPTTAAAAPPAAEKPAASLPQTSPKPAALPTDAAPAVTAQPPTSASAVADIDQDDDAEVREIFLEEAREVVGNGLAALEELATDASNLGQQTTVRRAFHTLKGSSRMVGLTEFGEAAWSMEQLFNAWLAEQKPASPALLQLARESMHGFGRWVEDIAAGTDKPWTSAPFRQAADAMRLDGSVVGLNLPGAAVQVVEPTPSGVQEVEE
ncbi:MAG: Hpt domain-containing protein, partial [Hylemonella sp.]|nr:Hpt domain-containing protein [Hylemonella sp.]